MQIRLCSLFERAVPADVFESMAHGQNGLLVRKWTPSTDISVGEPWLHVLVPATTRGAVMKTAHDMLGYSGVRKTYDCILRHLFWSKLKKDVPMYIITCHICQMTGKPNQVIRPVPLQPVPVEAAPFEYLQLGKGIC